MGESKQKSYQLLPAVCMTTCTCGETTIISHRAPESRVAAAQKPMAGKHLLCFMIGQREKYNFVRGCSKF